MSRDAKITLGALGVIAVLIFVVIAVFGHSQPQHFLDENYEQVSGSDPGSGTVAYQSDDGVRATVAAIDEGTNPDDQVDGTGGDADSVFLRYDDDYIVEVAPDGSGDARIELDDFDRGYSRHGGAVFIWGNFRGGGGSFGGGGSGSGK